MKRSNNQPVRSILIRDMQNETNDEKYRYDSVTKPGGICCLRFFDVIISRIFSTVSIVLSPVSVVIVVRRPGN